VVFSAIFFLKFEKIIPFTIKYSTLLTYINKIFNKNIFKLSINSPQSTFYLCKCRFVFLIIIFDQFNNIKKNLMRSFYREATIRK
jgi:hypothetical protein